MCMTSRSKLLLVITVAFHALHDGLLKDVDMAQRDSLFLLDNMFLIYGHLVYAFVGGAFTTNVLRLLRFCNSLPSAGL